MRQVSVADITAAVSDLCQTANFDLGEDVVTRVRQSLVVEGSPVGREILQQILDNAAIAAEERVAMCQDTGFAVVFCELGQDVRLVGGGLEEAINEGVRIGYREGYLRKSIVEHPWRRKNTGDNTPAVVHLRLVPGDRVKLTVAPKGGGSENMSRLAMLKPADGLDGIRRFVVDSVVQAGPNPCPPVVIGVGVGGTFERVALLAKEALLRPLGRHHSDPEVAALERAILEEVNLSGVGPAGLGGRITALWASVETYPCHIASLPVAVNLNCHAARHKETVL